MSAEKDIAFSLEIREAFREVPDEKYLDYGGHAVKLRTMVLGWMFLSGLGPLVQGNPQESPVIFPVLKGPYLGQTLPGMKAELFAPGIVSTGMTERTIATTPDGREIYFELAFGRIVTIMMTKVENGRWTEPAIAPFASDLKYFHFEPCLSADGRKILFLSNRPRQDDKPKPGWAYQHIWAADRKEGGQWGEPYDLGDPINSGQAEFFPSLADDDTLYFTRSTPSGEKPMIWRSRCVGGKYQLPEALPDTVNGKGSLYNACIAPDESYLIACVDGREDSLAPGLPNYYIFFRSANDRWSEGINLGADINFPGAAANAPYVARDAKYFFFGSTKTKPFNFSTNPVTSQMLLEYFTGPQNGDSDIYWIEASFLKKLRPAASK